MNRSTWIPILAAALAVSACNGKDITAPTEPPPASPPPTTSYAAVAATVTAAPVWEVGYSWGLEASEPVGSFSIGGGGSTSAQFAVDAARGVASSRTGASGQVCVSNSGAAATQGLQVVARVQRQDGEAYVDVNGATQSLSVGSQIAAGQSSCYPYEIVFARDEAASYRTVAQLSIANAEPAGAGANVPSSASIVFPAEPQASASGASLSAAVSCADGFECSSAQNEWNLENSDSVNFVLNVQDTGADCGSVAQITATFTLLAAGSDPMQVQRVLEIATAPCACIQPAGYWKDNSGLNGAPDYVSAKLPILLGSAGGVATLEISTAAQARQVFDHLGEASNGINKLYRQLLTARLNIANGADGAEVASVIAAADAFLASNGSASWSGLSNAQRSQVNGWQEALAAYNDGEAGTGACS